MTDHPLDPGPCLITSTGGRIYRHKDDPPGHYRIPGGTRVIGRRHYHLFTRFTEPAYFDTEGAIDLSTEKED